jgi:serine/threonine-protein kinase
VNEQLLLSVQLRRKCKHSDQTDLPSSTAGTSINTISPWKLEILPELQTLLSLQVGPIAKLLLKNAAGNVDNIDDLCDKLLAHIPSEKGREQFLEGVSDLRKKLARSTESSIRSGAGEALAMSQAASTELTTGFNVTNPGQAGLQAAASSAPVEMSAEMIANAELKLLTIMGPIAKIIVKRAANKTRDPQQFYDLLASNIPTEAQRGGFLRDVGVH